MASRQIGGTPPSSSSSSSSSSVGRSVQKRVQLFEKYSSLPIVQSVERLNYEDMHIGQTLGTGTYSRVYHATAFDNREYAVKVLSDRLGTSAGGTTMTEREFKTGSADLALEAQLLARIDHPNCIQLHAVKAGDFVDSINEGKYFLLLDLLSYTLEDKFVEWKEQDQKSTLGRLRVNVTKKQQARLLNRVEQSALGIARGMEYLHQRGIIFRDLKPQNIGFAMDSTVKIFDFGIARDLNQCRNSRPPTTLGFAGTPRYMAPEIGEGLQYDHSADVYSFGILLWEICALSKPYPEMSTLDDYQQTVVVEDKRPNTSLIKHRGLLELMEDCWQKNPSSRPDFSEIRERLEDILKLSFNSADEDLAACTVALQDVMLRKDHNQLDETMTTEIETPPVSPDMDPNFRG